MMHVQHATESFVLGTLSPMNSMFIIEGHPLPFMFLRGDVPCFLFPTSEEGTPPRTPDIHMLPI
jgi:hypothetical protein